jgi:hypothetical protein
MAVGAAIAILVIAGTSYAVFRDLGKGPTYFTVMAVLMGIGALAGTIAGSIFARTEE